MYFSVEKRVVGLVMEKRCVHVCVRWGSFLEREAGIFSNYLAPSPSHLIGQGRHSRARLLVLGACSPFPGSPPHLSPLQQPCNAHKITLIEFVSLQMKWIVKDKMTSEKLFFFSFEVCGGGGGGRCSCGEQGDEWRQ